MNDRRRQPAAKMKWGHNSGHLKTVASLALASATALAADSITPDDHFMIERPAELSAEQAETIYNGIAEQMREGYAQSRYSSARDYQNWQRFNTSPYLSPGHGNRFLNNYGNDQATDYFKMADGGTLPAGAILAKDSFTVTAAENVYPGALFLMEKLPAGTNSATADWRYVMLLPDGSVLGDTTGANPDSMTFCHACHLQAKSSDYLFLLPDKLRR
jgi:hypothetical protein